MSVTAIRSRSSGRGRARGAVTVLTAGIAVLGLSAPAAGQTSPGGPRLEIGGGLLLAGGSAAGRATATETPNQTDPGNRTVLFGINSRLQAAVGLTTHVGLRLTKGVAVEGGFTYSRPSISTSIFDDLEGASNRTITGPSLHQYVVDIGLVVHVDRLRPSARSVPFLRASIGYLRHVATAGVNVDSGRVYQFGGGLKHLLGASQRTGLRFDARLGVRDGGFSLEQATRRTFVVLGGGAFVAF